MVVNDSIAWLHDMGFGEVEEQFKVVEKFVIWFV